MTGRINVLLLITELNVGGAERVVEQLATCLPGHRYNVTVACLYDPHAVGPNIRAEGIPVINLAMRSKWDLRAPYGLWRLLRGEEIQILHAHLFHANLLAAIIGRLANVSIIIATRHNVDIGGTGREWVNRWARKACDAVVAISQDVYQAELQRSCTASSKVALIPNGVQVGTFADVDRSHVESLAREWDIDHRAPVIGTLARLHEQKGHAYLLEAVARLRSQLPDITALIVGDGPLRREMEAKAKKVGLSETVIFTGVRRDVAEILALLDIFVLPSLWEGLPIALLEAMAAGLPVVATAVGGTPEVVVDGVTGILVPPRDPDALAEAILRLLREPDLRRSMGQAGRARVEQHFSIAETVRRTEELYAALLKEKGY